MTVIVTINIVIIIVTIIVIVTLINTIVIITKKAIVIFTSSSNLLSLSRLQVKWRLMIASCYRRAGNYHKVSKKNVKMILMKISYETIQWLWC